METKRRLAMIGCGKLIEIAVITRESLQKGLSEEPEALRSLERTFALDKYDSVECVVKEFHQQGLSLDVQFNGETIRMFRSCLKLILRLKN